MARSSSSKAKPRNSNRQDGTSPAPATSLASTKSKRGASTASHDADSYSAFKRQSSLKRRSDKKASQRSLERQLGEYRTAQGIERGMHLAPGGPLLLTHAHINARYFRRHFFNRNPSVHSVGSLRLPCPFRDLLPFPGPPISPPPPLDPKASACLVSQAAKSGPLRNRRSECFPRLQDQPPSGIVFGRSRRRLRCWPGRSLSERRSWLRSPLDSSTHLYKSLPRLVVRHSPSWRAGR